MPLRWHPVPFPHGYPGKTPDRFLKYGQVRSGSSNMDEIDARVVKGYGFEVLGSGYGVYYLLKELLGVVLLEELHGVVRLDACHSQG